MRKFSKNKRSSLVIDNATGKILGVVGGTMVASSSFAAAIDYSPITSAVDVSTVATGIVALVALKMVPNVTAWASKKLARFFG